MEGNKEQNEWLSFLVCCSCLDAAPRPVPPGPAHAQPQLPSLSPDFQLLTGRNPPGHTSGSFLKSLRVSQKAKVCAGNKWAWGPTKEK